MDQPLVSIGIPTYNRPEGLKHVLDCLRVQTYSNLEIIVSDNCSQGDSVSKMMEEYLKIDSRIHYFKQMENIGPTANFEFVLSKATGYYFAWAADDDFCSRDFLEKIVCAMRHDPQIILCTCDVQGVDENSNLLDVHRLESIRSSANWQQTRKLFFRYPTSNIFFCVYGVYKTHIIKQCGLDIFRGWKGFTTNGEVPLLAKLSAWGKIAALPEVLKMYRSHPNSVYYNEIRGLSNYDSFMMRLVIRAKLCKLALMNDEPLWIKLGLLKTVIGSYLETIKIRTMLLAFLPRKFKEILKPYAKKMSHLWR